MALKTLGPRVGALPIRVKSVAPGSWRQPDASSAQRGYGYKWQQARAAYLKAHPLCVFCLRDAGVTATELPDQIAQCVEKRIAPPMASVVDHKVAHRGDMKLFWDRDNWQSLCPSCHSSVKQRMEKSGG
ncbi:HNH endonuclease signature motif containing protein [Massilia sp. TS11]|uniref:HNH endonuclease signature motif containing protein n=1 Tax=Massilia sp. TS11 TaxID=2908003 RepID=UPI001EDAE328|nr:HNH endonuclease signature motif containing protein [Massilia sp. TS11]MCG2586507.1 HNH endonuclease [Massilia sp. TS11]